MRDDDKDLKRSATTTTGTTITEHHDLNPDPLTGEPGAHPVGTGVGAATGGTVGAVIGGAVGGPLGAMVGAAVGGLAGGLAGKGISESVNPTEEDAFWRDHYSTRPYASGRTYEDLQPAYRYGWEARTRHEDRNWSDVEKDLGRDWNERHGSTLSWDKARNATQDAWNRVDARHRFNSQEDNYWRSNYSNRPYASGRTYEDLQPAYRYGYESRYLNKDRDWNSAQNDLERGWDKAKANTRHGWNEVKDAVKDGWDRLTDPSDVDHSRSTFGTSGWQNEDNYWRNNYSSRPYASGRTYDDLSPAYRYGYDSANQFRGRSWNEVENDLERGWDKAKGTARSTWHEAKDAVKDAWHRVERATPGDADRDGR